MPKTQVRILSKVLWRHCQLYIWLAPKRHDTSRPGWLFLISLSNLCWVGKTMLSAVYSIYSKYVNEIQVAQCTEMTHWQKTGWYYLQIPTCTMYSIAGLKQEEERHFVLSCLKRLPCRTNLEMYFSSHQHPQFSVGASPWISPWMRTIWQNQWCCLTLITPYPCMTFKSGCSCLAEFWLLDWSLVALQCQLAL